MKIQDISFPTKQTDRKNLIGKIPYKEYYFSGTIRSTKKRLRKGAILYQIFQLLKKSNHL